MTDLRDLLTALRDDAAVRVIVFDSADPEFFIAHVDMTATPDALRELATDLPEGINVFQVIGELLRSQPQVTIVELAGKARGGGAEFVAAADLTGRIGRNRALEVVLGADLFDAETAERYGWVNRALPAEELRPFVDRLARHIAALPEGVIAAAKHAIAAGAVSDGLRRENDAWAGLVFRQATARLMSDGLAKGAQTRRGERELENVMRGAGAHADVLTDHEPRR